MPRNLALNISVGALLDSSVVKTFKAATDSSEKLGAQQKALNKEMRQLNAVRRYTDQLDKLKKEARASGQVSETLARRLRLTETRLSAASEDARRMGLNIKDLGQAEAKLHRQLDKNNRALKLRQKLGSGLRRARAGAGFVGRQARNAALVGGTTVGALLTGITMTNRLTAEQANLARAVQISAKDMAAWSSIVQQAGFDSEAFNSLIEELNNKFGESKGLAEQTTAVQEAMQILRLDFEKIKRLKPDQQFLAIIKAAQQLGGQEAVSAADILLGGEANRIVGYFNSLGVPVERLFNEVRDLQIISEGGIEGARKFNVAWLQLSSTLGQAFSEVSGLIGEELAPQMRQWSKDLADWFKTNRDDIGSFSKDLGTTLKRLGVGLGELAKNLPTIVRAMTTLSDVVMDWFGPDEPEQHFPQQRGLAKRLRQQRRDEQAEKAQAEKEKAAREMVESRQPVARNVSQDNTMNVTYQITQQPGESAEQLAGRIDQHNRRLQNDRITHDAFDQPEAMA